MDGTKYVAQCPIARGSSFTYKFQVRGGICRWGCCCQAWDLKLQAQVPVLS
jgi:hypothetical protein